MSQDFYQHIFAKQQKLEAVPSNKEITAWALKVIHLLYPEQTGQQYASIEELKDEFFRLEDELCEIMQRH
ncbi:hypothetical protein ACFJIV_29635 [Mucilaginibacter sp. UC70_90]